MTLSHDMLAPDQEIAAQARAAEQRGDRELTRQLEWLAARTRNYQRSPAADAPGCDVAERTVAARLEEYRGPHSAISPVQCAERLHLKVARLQAIVEHLRAQHALPICMTLRGAYFLPRNREDAAETVATLRAQLDDLTATLCGLEQGLDARFQPELFAPPRGA
jgi:hypothetical protein